MRIAKKLLATTMALIIALGMMSTVVQANQRIRVVVDGYEVSFPDQEPILVNGRVMVPVRGVFEQMGFDVFWDRDAQTAVLTNAEITVIVPTGSRHFTVNGERHTPEVAAQMVQGRLMLPLRAVAEAVGGTASWDSSARVAEITSPQYVVHPLVGTWYWNAYERWVYVFEADGTGVRGFFPHLEGFEWTTPEPGHIDMEFTGSTLWRAPVEQWTYTIVGDSFILESRQLIGLSYTYLWTESIAHRPTIERNFEGHVLVGTWVFDENEEIVLTFFADGVLHAYYYGDREYGLWYAYNNHVVLIAEGESGYSMRFIYENEVLAIYDPVFSDEVLFLTRQ